MKSHAQASLSHVTDPVALARYRLVHDFVGGSAAMAEFLDLAHGTVRNKAHPEGNDDFTMDQAVEAMNLARDYRLLDAMAQKCDRVTVELEKFGATGDVGLLEQYTAMEAQHGKLAQDIHAALADKKLTKPHIHKVKATLLRLISEQEGMVARLSAVAESD